MSNMMFIVQVNQGHLKMLKKLGVDTKSEEAVRKFIMDTHTTIAKELLKINESNAKKEEAPSA